MRLLVKSLLLGAMAGICWAEGMRVDTAALETLYMKLGTAIQAGDWPTATKLASDYSDSEDFSAHLGAA